MPLEPEGIRTSNETSPSNPYSRVNSAPNSAAFPPAVISIESCFVENVNGLATTSMRTGNEQITIRMSLRAQIRNELRSIAGAVAGGLRLLREVSGISLALTRGFRFFLTVVTFFAAASVSAINFETASAAVCTAFFCSDSAATALSNAAWSLVGGLAGLFSRLGVVALLGFCEFGFGRVTGGLGVGEFLDGVLLFSIRGIGQLLLPGLLLAQRCNFLPGLLQRLVAHCDAC